MRERPITSHAKSSRPARLSRTPDAPIWWLVIAVSTATACCVHAPAALVVIADLTLSAAAGLGVGMAIVVTACVVRTLARSPTASETRAQSDAEQGASLARTTPPVALAAQLARHSHAAQRR
jgi:hypothetical protein